MNYSNNLLCFLTCGINAIKKKRFGDDAATELNTNCAMKAGVKNCDANGNSGPIPCRKGQQRVVCNCTLIFNFSNYILWKVTYFFLSLFSRIITFNVSKLNTQMILSSVGTHWMSMSCINLEVVCLMAVCQ